MAITLIVGNPGDGKSYSAVHLCILPAVQSGRPVFTNIPIAVDLIRKDFNLPADQYLRFVPVQDISSDIWPNLPGGCLVVVDEVWRYWPEKTKPGTEAESFFAEHRHRVGNVGDRNLSQDIVILTQDTGDIASFIKRRVAETFVVSKLTALGMNNRFSLKRYRGIVSKLRPLKSSFISESFGTYLPSVYRYYETHTKKDQTAAIDLRTVEAGTTKQKTIFHSFRFRIYFLALVVVFGYLVWRGSSGNFLTFGQPPVAKAPPPAQTKPASPAMQPHAKPAPAPPASSVSAPAPAPDPAVLPTSYLNAEVATRFWIKGHIKAGEGDMLSKDVILILTDGQRTIVARVPEKDCEVRGFLWCSIDNVRFSEIPPSRSPVVAHAASVQAQK